MHTWLAHAHSLTHANGAANVFYFDFRFTDATYPHRAESVGAFGMAMVTVGNNIPWCVHDRKLLIRIHTIA